MLHEIGHSFGLLADEYAGGGPTCNNAVEPPEVNVTRESMATSIKWSYWIEPGTPVPAGNTSRLGVVSAYEGAKYCDFGLYRPTFASKMRELSRPFEQVNTEQMIRRIYNFVSPIDAVSPTTTELQSERCESLDFSVKTPGAIRPSGTIQTSWSINGEAVATGNHLAVDSCRLPIGRNRIEVEVRDVTIRVRRDLDNALAERFRWDLETRVSSGNRPPVPVRTLPGRTLAPDGTVDMDVSAAFEDPDGDALTYTVTSSAPQVVTALVLGTRLTLTAVGVGTATIRVTAADPGGLSAAQSFTATVTDGPMSSFTDDPIQPGVTPVRAVHLRELRGRIDNLRVEAGLSPYPWTDPVLRAGVTPVRMAHLLDLREALGAAYVAARRSVPAWTDTAPRAGQTPIRAVHLMELRRAVVALE